MYIISPRNELVRSTCKHKRHFLVSVFVDRNWMAAIVPHSGRFAMRPVIRS
eukprot:SAG22_NODE_2552_length_2452_cov_29.460604_2_plen_51_part_00